MPSEKMYKAGPNVPPHKAKKYQNNEENKHTEKPWAGRGGEESKSKVFEFGPLRKLGVRSWRISEKNKGIIIKIWVKCDFFY